MISREPQIEQESKPEKKQKRNPASRRCIGKTTDFPGTVDGQQMNKGWRSGTIFTLSQNQGTPQQVGLLFKLGETTHRAQAQSGYVRPDEQEAPGSPRHNLLPARSAAAIVAQASAAKRWRVEHLSQNQHLAFKRRETNMSKTDPINDTDPNQNQSLTSGLPKHMQRIKRIFTPIFWLSPNLQPESVLMALPSGKGVHPCSGTLANAQGRWQMGREPAEKAGMRCTRL